MDYFTMDDSQFFLDPNFSFDGSLGEFPDMSQMAAEPVQLGSSQQLRLKSRIRASRACIACRSRHMKCDSVEPVCTRCQTFGKTCVYTKSRRGGSHKVPTTQVPKSSPHTQTPGSATGQTLSLDADNVSKRSWETISNPQIFPEYSPLPATTSGSRFGSEDVDLMASYYEFFNDAHPVVLPKQQLLKRMESDPASLEHLLPVMNYIGSVYIPEISSAPYQKLAEEALSSATLPTNGFSVQALALFALARHCADEYDIADQYVDKAIDIALSIGMNVQEFAEANGEGDAFLQESWRRTWWLAYTLDGLFATISHHCSHRLQNTAMDVDLPCEDADYGSGQIPTPHTLSEYDSREFSETETTFSSLTYLIDAIRILSAIMSTVHSPQEPGSKALTAADAKFVNWTLYLPRNKQEIIQPNGTIDEVLFLAHLVINTEKLLLHRPHSHLPYSPLESRSKCTPPPSSRETRSLQQSLAMHTAKALDALTASIMLFALPGRAIRHSPIATCALALAVMAQVSACGFFTDGQGGGDERVGIRSYEARGENGFAGKERAYAEGRDRVRLGLGALRAGVRVWGLARRSVREVVGVSRELLVGDQQITAERCESGGGRSEEGDVEMVVR